MFIHFVLCVLHQDDLLIESIDIALSWYVLIFLDCYQTFHGFGMPFQIFEVGLETFVQFSLRVDRFKPWDFKSCHHLSFTV